MVTVPFQFEPRYYRAHTAKSKPAAVRATATLNDHVADERKRALRNEAGEFGSEKSSAATASGPTCERRDGKDSCRTVRLTLRAETHQQAVQLSHIAWKKRRHNRATSATFLANGGYSS